MHKNVQKRKVVQKRTKRLCVFYRLAWWWQQREFTQGRKIIDWMVCQECQKKIRSGNLLIPSHGREKTETLVSYVRSLHETLTAFVNRDRCGGHPDTCNCYWHLASRLLKNTKHI